MDGNIGVETFRTLSQVEGDMKKAERVFVGADARFNDAHARLREAEAAFQDAHHAREAALRVLDESHAEIDRTVAMLRDSSPAGCRWRAQADSHVILPDNRDGFDLVFRN